MGDQVLVGGLVGAIVAAAGAIANFVATRRRDRDHWAHDEAVERRRWEREDRIRDYQERRTAYATFLKLADHRHSGAPDLMDEAAGVDSYNEFVDALNHVRLIGPPSVSGLADHLEIAIRHGVSMAEYKGLKSAFIEAAREDLGKPSEWAHRSPEGLALTTCGEASHLDGGAL